MANKRIVLWLILDSVFLVVFNAVFFIAGGTDHQASVWISYGFIHLAFLMTVVTPALVHKNGNPAVFGLPLYIVSAVYFFAEFITGLICIFVNSDSYKTTLIVQVILAAIYAVALICNLIANDHTKESLKSREVNVAYIKESASRVKGLMYKATDKAANREIERVYDELSSSPSKSTEAARSLEFDIFNRISILEAEVRSDSSSGIIAVSGEIINLIEERNRTVKLPN